MRRFKVGDRVILADFDTEFGYFCIPPECWGKEYVIKDLYTGSEDGYSIERNTNGEFLHWGVRDAMLDPALPLSPFDIAVRAYIKQELNP